MRIIHYGNIWRGYGGTDETVRTILREMARKGHECYAVTFDNAQQTLQRKVAEDGVTEVQLTDKEDFSGIMSLINDETVVYTVLNSHIDLWKVLEARNVPVVHEYNMPKMKWYPLKGKNARFVFNSKWTKSWYPTLEGRVIYPLIDFSKYTVDPSAKDGKTIGMINPCKVKGVDIVKKVAKNMPDYNFLLCGGWGHKSVGGIVHIPCYPNVKYMKHADCVSGFYNPMDVLLVPSQSSEFFALNHDESYGRVVLEGMYHGCAVISSYKDGLVEAMDEGGYLVGAHGQVNYWQESIKLVFKNIDRYKKMSADRLKRYQDAYPGYVNDWENTFKEAINGTHSN